MYAAQKLIKRVINGVKCFFREKILRLCELKRRWNCLVCSSSIMRGINNVGWGVFKKNSIFFVNFFWILIRICHRTGSRNFRMDFFPWAKQRHFCLIYHSHDLFSNWTLRVLYALAKNLSKTDNFNKFLAHTMLNLNCTENCFSMIARFLPPLLSERNVYTIDRPCRMGPGIGLLPKLHFFEIFL